MGGDNEKCGDYERYVPEGGVRKENLVEKLIFGVGRFFDAPVTWFRESIVVPNQKSYPWYHREFRRVPTIDECDIGDVLCIYEADYQFRRDRLVDTEIISILRTRVEDCQREEFPDLETNCEKLQKDYLKATEDWFIKYGDMGAYYNVRTAFMKQKHRMIWERRHGEVGTGMKNNE